MLSELTGLADPSGARALADELGFLPMALAQAAAVIVTQRLDYATYPGRLRQLSAGNSCPGYRAPSIRAAWRRARSLLSVKGERPRMSVRCDPLAARCQRGVGGYERCSGRLAERVAWPGRDGFSLVCGRG
jgi:hypothetical protein